MNSMELQFKNAAKLLSVVIFLLGVTVIFGWLLDIAELKSIFPGMVAMKANTAVLFILLSGGFMLRQWMHDGLDKLRRVLVVSFSIVVLLVSALTIIEYIWGFDFGIDQLLFKEATNAILTSSPGRMALNTAIAFMLSGASLLFLESKKVAFAWTSQILATAVGAIGALGFMGYVYGTDPLYVGLHFSTAMALHTTIGFIFFAVAAIFISEGGAFDIIAGQEAGSKILRRIFPVAVLLPILFGWAELHANTSGLFNEGIRVTIAAIANAVFVSGYLFLLAFYTNREDSNRTITEKKLADSERLLRESQRVAFIGSYKTDFSADHWDSSETLDEIFGIDKNYNRSVSGWSDLIAPDDRGMMVAYLNNVVIAERGIFNKEYRIIRKKDGALRWVHGLGHCTFDSDGRILKMVGTIQDITEDKLEADALAEKYTEIESLNKMMVGRELRMSELKKERDTLQAKIDNK